jgi:hypothetical protein
MTTITEGIYSELRSRGSHVMVQALCPGFTYSEFHDKMGVDRMGIAGRSFWHSAEFVVDASLDGLRRRQLFVIPGWRYRLLTGFLNALPARLRVAMETFIAPRKDRKGQLAAGRTGAQIESGKP